MLLARVWLRIVVDKGLYHEYDDQKVGLAARSQFTDNLDAQGVANLSSFKVTPQVWVSFNVAHENWDPI